MTLRHAWLVVTLALSAGCADLIELQYDPLGDRRPSTMVQQLRNELEGLKDAYRNERKGGYGPIDFNLGELARAADGMDEDLRRKGGAFGTHVAKAQEATGTLDPLFARARMSPNVHGRWGTVRATLRNIVTEFGLLGNQGIYKQ